MLQLQDKAQINWIPKCGGINNILPAFRSINFLSIHLVYFFTPGGTLFKFTRSLNLNNPFLNENQSLLNCVPYYAHKAVLIMLIIRQQEVYFSCYTNFYTNQF